MKKFIPDFISEKYFKGEYEGTFTGCVMFLDLTGFTSITDKLMKEDKEGIEVLGNFISRTFERIITSIHGKKGFVSSFEGDALTAIFPGEESHTNALLSSDEITGYFSDKSVFRTRFGNFYMSIKTGISFGEIEFSIIGNDLRKIYYFSGETVKNCIECENNCDMMETVIDARMNVKSFRSAKTRPLSNNMFVLEKLLIAQKTEYVLTEQSADASEKFIHPGISKITRQGEFRLISPVFISIKQTEANSVESVVLSILNLSSEFRGHVNKITYTDKGFVSLVLFGAPVSFDNNIERACGFSLKLKDIHGDNIKIGMTHGTVYAGFVGGISRCEYTALGSVVNLASRLMTRSEYGEILITDDVGNKVKDKFITGEFLLEKLKGFNKEQRIGKLMSKKNKLTDFETEFVGRENELSFLTGQLKKTCSGFFPGLHYIYGEAGMGKSQLIKEFTKRSSKNARTFIFTTDPVVKKSMNPVKLSLNKCFDISEQASLSENKTAFENKFSELFKNFVSKTDADPPSDEILRIKVFVGYFLGFFSNHPMISDIENSKLPELINLSLRDFFRFLSSIKPIIIVFDDFNDYDSDSLAFIKTLFINIEHYPIMIIFSSRLNDDLSKPKIQTDPEIEFIDILLSELLPEQNAIMIENFLCHKCDKDLLYFIHERAGGNPFYTEQYCFFLLENGHLRLSENIFRLDRNTEEIPVRINDIIVSRIDRLTGEIKETIVISSVLGMEFEVDVLKELIKIYRTHSEKASKQFDDIDGVIKTTTGFRIWKKITELKYIFSHSLLRNTVYQMQLKEHLRSLHKLVGEVLLNKFKDDPAHYPEIAYHFENAELMELACEYYKKSAVESLEKYYVEKAWEYLKKSLKISVKLYGSCHPETSKILKITGRYLFEKGDYRSSVSVLEKSLEILEKFNIEDVSLKIKYFIDIGINYRYMGEYDKALKFYESCISLLPENSDLPEEILTNLAVIYKEKNEYQKSLDYSNKALKIQKNNYGELDERVADTYNNIGVVLTEINRLDEALEYHNKSIEIMEKIGKSRSPKNAYFTANISVCCYYNNDLQKSIKYIDKAIDVLKDIYGEKHPDIAFLYGNKGAIYNDVPDYEGAIYFFGRALEIYQDTLGLETVFACNIFNNIGYSYLENDNLEEALKYTEKALSGRMKHFGKHHAETATSLNQLGNIQRELGNLEESLKHLGASLFGFTKIFGVNNKYSIIVLINMAKTLMKTGNLTKARVIIERADQINKLLDIPDDQSTARIEELFGDLYSSMGDIERSKAHYYEAENIYKKIGLPKYLSSLKEKLKNVSD
ncbi:tetratricopeptide repeat protein [candidate division WOR-3 bacterium]|nr:tetratricopeptide repeat protein [candidate division WOR-3 bacterium]